MTNLTATGARALATTRQHSHMLDHIEPTWGMFDVRHAWDTMPVTRPLPSVQQLTAMELELTRALAPISEAMDAPAALAKLTEATTTLIDSYPQRDQSSRVYAQQVMKRLAECPPDLLDKVIDRLVDDNPDFRPGAGRVAGMVRNVVAKRKLTLMRVQAALRYHATAATMKAEAAQRNADRKAAVERALSRPDDAPMTPIGVAVYGCQTAANDEPGITLPASAKTA